MDAHCGSSIAQDSTESAADETVHRAEVDRNVEEAERMIQELNELGLGESITGKEYLNYFAQLPCQPPRPDTELSDGQQIQDLLIRHALYRLKYYKLSKQQPQKNGLHNDDKLKEACYLLGETSEYFVDYGNQLYEDLDALLENSECIKEDISKLWFLESHEYFQQFEEDGTLDWSFHREYCMLASLDDYQRLVPWYDYAYLDWEKYHMFLHSHEVDVEYLEYCEELSKKLKWMEDYLCIGMSSLAWDRISTRGAYQALKIATGFSKITVDLAYTGYRCVDGMGFDACRSELNIYFGIWLRVTKLKMSMGDAFDEVLKLNKVPLHLRSKVEKQFYTYTKGISGEVTDGTAMQFIGEAIKNKWQRPKFYEDYVRKKMDIARAIGLLYGIS